MKDDSSSSSESSSSDSDSSEEVPANKADKKEAKAIGKQIVGKPLAKEIKEAQKPKVVAPVSDSDDSSSSDESSSSDGGPVGEPKVVTMKSTSEDEDE